MAASGCAALIYEIVWLQLLQLVIGSTAICLGVLLGTFMGGMCLGSLALPAPLKRALVAARQHLEVATPEAAAGVLRQLLAPAREVLGADAAEALSLAVRAAALH